MIRYKLLDGGRAPERKSKNAAGFDLYAAKNTRVWHGIPGIIPTGVCLEMPDGMYAQVVSRSGLMSTGVQVSTGIIDADYRGEISVVLNNFRTSGPYWVGRGDRIAQLVFLPIPHEVLVGDMVQVDELSETERGSGGFGSTGK